MPTTITLPTIADSSDPVSAAAWHMYLAELHLKALKEALREESQNVKIGISVSTDQPEGSSELVFRKLLKIKEVANGYYKSN